VPLDRRSFVQGGAALSAGVLAAGATGGKSMPKPNELYPDPLYTEPFVDKDEWRDQPTRHRYVHGGFQGTDLRFSMYFPPKEQYQGRFFHPVMHIAGSENVAYTGRLAGLDGDSISFAAESGAYLVESNQGSTTMHTPTPDMSSFRASAATAQYGRILAVQMYGEHRPYGYIYGGSGGSYKTFACVENTHGVWDGCVPFIHGSPASLPNVFTVQAHALRLLDGKFDGIVDALEPGGSGDMYAGLTEEQKAALKEVTLMGMPPRAWFAHERLALNYTAVLASVIGTVFNEDPTYFQDFWKLPGYLGANPPQSLKDARIQQSVTLKAVVTTAEARKLGLPVGIAAGTRDTAPAAFRLSELPKGRLQGAFVLPRSGTGVGQRLMITGVIGDVVMMGFDDRNMAALEGMRPGDALDIDNSDYLAVQTYHRHQNPSNEYTVWDQFRGPDGQPIYPQRPLIKGYDQVGPGNSWQSGKFDCKMITVDCMMDEAAYPWQVDWYRNQVKKQLGPRFDNQYRVWFVDHAMHVNPSRYLMPNEGADEPTEHHGPTDTHIVSYAGVLQQALRDVAAWAEKGIPPVVATDYRMIDGQIELPATAAERHGLQQVVDLTANGGLRADVKVGQPVELVGLIETPAGVGQIISAEWDYDGGGAFVDIDSFTDAATKRTVKRTYAFDKPGSYIVAVRVTVQRKDAVGTPFAKIINLGRARVVVA
jgi:hypothetical protein